MTKFDLATLTSQQYAHIAAILALALLTGKRIYQSYFASEFRSNDAHRNKNVLFARLCLAGHTSILSILTGLFLDASFTAMAWTTAAVALATIAPAAYLYLRSNNAQDDVTNAENNTAVALAAFDKLIHTGGDLLGRKDLKISIDSATLSPSERLAARYLLENYEDVGHVIQSSSKKMLMPGTPGVIYATKKQVRVYGISRDDLKKYPTRLRKRKASWL